MRMSLPISPVIMLVYLHVNSRDVRLTNPSQERAQKSKSSMFDRMVNQLSAAAVNSAPTGTSTSAQAAAALMRFGGINAERINDRSSEEPLREEDGFLDMAVAEKMLKWHAEAIGRCVELSPVGDV